MTKITDLPEALSISGNDYMLIAQPNQQGGYTSRKVKSDRVTRSDIPKKIVSYTVDSLPAAGAYPASLIYVSNGAAGSPCLAFSNGSNWLRCDNLSPVSAS